MVVLSFAPAFFLIAIVAILDRWARLEPNGFAEALDRASRYPLLASLAVSLYLVGLAIAAGSHWLMSRSPGFGGRRVRALPVVSAVVLSVAGAAMLVVTLSLGVMTGTT